jgi:hypothetical protein
VGLAVFWVGVVLLTLIWYNNIAGPPPPPRTAPIGSLIMFSLTVSWAYGVNRLWPNRGCREDEFDADEAIDVTRSRR